MGQKFFTSDLHIGHRRLAKMRGFLPYMRTQAAATHAMDEWIVKQWNSVVTDADETYLLGDVGLCSPDRIAAILPRLRGHIYLIKGNHDNRTIKDEACAGRFEWIKDVHEMKYKGCHLVLSHYAHRTWNNAHKGSIMLFGHSHGSLADDGQRTMDVGWDVWGRPISYDEVRQHLHGRRHTPVDHHGDTDENHSN